MSNNFMKEKIIGNIISLNPTGIITLDNSGTFKMNGQNNIIMSPSSLSNTNLSNANNNKFICNKDNIVETFENYFIKDRTNDKKKNNKIFFFIILIFLLLLILLIY